MFKLGLVTWGSAGATPLRTVVLVVPMCTHTAPHSPPPGCCSPDAAWDEAFRVCASHLSVTVHPVQSISCLWPLLLGPP